MSACVHRLSTASVVSARTMQRTLDEMTYKCEEAAPRLPDGARQSITALLAHEADAWAREAVGLSHTLEVAGCDPAERQELIARATDGQALLQSQLDEALIKRATLRMQLRAARTQRGEVTARATEQVERGSEALRLAREAAKAAEADKVAAEATLDEQLALCEKAEAVSDAGCPQRAPLASGSVGALAPGPLAPRPLAPRPLAPRPLAPRLLAPRPLERRSLDRCPP